MLIAEQMTMPPETLVFREGAMCDALFILLSGQVEITKKDRSGRNQPLAVIHEGSVLGEMSLLSTGSLRSATATARSEITLLKLSTKAFTNLLNAERLVAYKAGYNLAQILSRRLVLMNEKILDLRDSGIRTQEQAEKKLDEFKVVIQQGLM